MLLRYISIDQSTNHPTDGTCNSIGQPLWSDVGRHWHQAPVSGLIVMKLGYKQFLAQPWFDKVILIVHFYFLVFPLAPSSINIWCSSFLVLRFQKTWWLLFLHSSDTQHSITNASIHTSLKPRNTIVYLFWQLNFWNRLMCKKSVYCIWQFNYGESKLDSNSQCSK